MSANTATGATGAAPKLTVKNNLIALTKSIQFSWFLGHVTTLLSTLIFFITYRSGGAFNGFFYRLAYLGILESFGIILFESFKTRQATLPTLLRDDNFQYTFDAIIWFFAPKTTLSLSPFLIFAVFHVLGYVKNLILPALNYPSTSPLLLKISSFIKNNNDRSLYYSANLELVLLAWLVVKALLFRKRSWILLGLYTIFIKLRQEKSAYTRAALKAYEVRIDGLLSDPRLPPNVKQYWAKLKSVLASTFGTPLIGGGAPVNKTK